MGYSNPLGTRVGEEMGSGPYMVHQADMIKFETGQTAWVNGR